MGRFLCFESSQSDNITSGETIELPHGGLWVVLVVDDLNDG